MQYIGEQPLLVRKAITGAQTNYTLVAANSTKKIVADQVVVAVGSAFAPSGARLHGTTNSGPMVRVSSDQPTVVVNVHMPTDLNDALKVDTDATCDVWVMYHTEDDRRY